MSFSHLKRDYAPSIRNDPTPLATRPQMTLEMHVASRHLFDAVETEDLELVRHILGFFCNCVHIRNEAGWTPLHLAAAYGQDQIVRALGDFGANVNDIDNDGRTPLHVAASNGNHQIVRILLNEFGANADAEDCEGCAPLLIAKLRDRANTVRVFDQELGAHSSPGGEVVTHHGRGPRYGHRSEK